MNALKLARLIGLGLLSTMISRASLITSANQIGASATVVDFSQFAGANTIYTTGPVSVGSGVTFRSTNPDGSLLGSGPYSFNNNGSWGSSVTLAGLDVDEFGGDQYTMTFAFAKPVSAVGGILDYAVFPSSGFSDVVITAFGINGAILASYDVTMKAPISGPAGEFLGISQSQADIAGFSLSNSAVAITDLTFSTAATKGTSPEPSTFFLLGAGGLLLFHVCRRKGRAMA